MEDNQKLIINSDGELIGTLDPGDRVIKKKSLEFLDAQKELQEWKITHFYKGNIDEIKQLNQELSIYEKGLLFTLSLYINYDDCCLKYPNGTELTFNDIVNISNMSKGKVSETMNKLRKKDILYKGTNSKGIQHFVNPWLFCRGSKINVVLKTMFKNYRIRIKEGKKWSEIEE